jgi:hypothetical protein
MNAARVQVRFGLLCDDIRREDNQKLILIGVYDADVRVAKIPTSLPIQLVLGIDVKEQLESAQLEVMVSLDDETLLTGKGKIGLPSAGKAMLPLPPMRLNIGHSGVLKFQVKFMPDDTWSPAWEGPIGLMEPA